MNFPPAFDAKVYRELNAGLRHLSGEQLRDHYNRIGKTEGEGQMEMNRFRFF